MEVMNQEIRRLVRVELAKRGMKQGELAERIGVSPQYLSDVLRDLSKGKMPDVWRDILKEFGWQLKIIDENGDEVK